MRRLALATLASLALAAGTAQADMYTYTLSTKVNGTASQGTAVATVADIGANTVQITMDLKGFNDTGSGSNVQFVVPWLFNYNGGAGTLTSSNFTYQTSESTGGMATVSVGTTNGANDIKAGNFNIEFTFPTSNGGTGVNARFTTGDVAVYNVTATGLTASMFNEQSTADGNNPGGYYTAIKVQAIGQSGKSGSMGTSEFTPGVPEPASVAMALTSSLCLGIVALRRRGRSA